MFGEKYGDEVRVVSIGDGSWSKEFCGGTHALTVGQLGVVKLLGESSIGSGVRRVEALVGADAYGHLARESAVLSQLTDIVKARPEELADRISTMLTRLKDAEREIDAIRRQQVLGQAAQLAETAGDVGGVLLLTHHVEAAVSGDDLRSLVLDLRSRLGEERPAVVALASVAKGRPVVVVATNAAAREKGIKAGALVKVAAGVLGGGGGGKDDLAQGGGTDATRIGDALGEIRSAITRLGA